MTRGKNQEPPLHISGHRARATTQWLPPLHGTR